MEKESENEFKDWAVDAPGEISEKIFNKWKKHCTNLNYIKEMKDLQRKIFRTGKFKNIKTMVK